MGLYLCNQHHKREYHERIPSHYVTIHTQKCNYHSRGDTRPHRRLSLLAIHRLRIRHLRHPVRPLEDDPIRWTDGRPHRQPAAGYAAQKEGEQKRLSKNTSRRLNGLGQVVFVQHVFQVYLNSAAECGYRHIISIAFKRVFS